jgi:thiamine pyrophosphate-dependent acetolactate synthase large subunit-like protein
MAIGLLPDNHPQSAAAARSFVVGQADVVMLIGARLNWLLAHRKGPLWSNNTQYVQVDVSPTEIDSNRPIAAPVVSDIKSAISAFLAALKPKQIQPSAEGLDEIAQRKQKNIERMATRLNANPRAPSPTGLFQNARYDKIIEAFGGAGYHVTDTPGLTKALIDALAAGKPTLINCVIDPMAGAESCHIQNLNPKSQLPNAA